MSTRRRVLIATAAATFAGSLSGSIYAFAQVRAAAQTLPATAERIGLKGYDPVAYFTLSAPTPGRADYEYAYDGVRYQFANARHRDMFKADPEKYAPQFGGSCAMNMANGIRRESDPTIWVIANDRLYVFAGTAGAQRFRLEPQAPANRATANWKTLRNTASQ